MEKSFFFLFLMLIPLTLFGQTNDSDSDMLERQYHVDTMKNRALEAMSRGDFEEALTILDTAIALSPKDPLLRDLKASILELEIITAGSPELTGGETRKPEFYDPESIAGNEGDDSSVVVPDFEEELIAGRHFSDPVQFREAFSSTLALHLGESRPVYLENDGFYQHDEVEELSTNYGVFGDFQYFFKGIDRALGVNLRYYGNLLNPEEGNILVHQMDLGIVLRGFFLESPEARSTVGFRFGASLLYLNDYERSRFKPALANALGFGVYYNDAVLRLLFRKRPFFQRIVFDLGVDYYYLTQSEDSYMIRYNGALTFQVTPEFRVGPFIRSFNTAQDIQILSSWSTGMLLNYSL